MRSLRRKPTMIAAMMIAVVAAASTGAMQALGATLCDKLVSYQLLNPTDVMAATAVMGTLFNRGIRGTEGSTTGGAIAASSMANVWTGAVQYRENTTVPQPFSLQGPSPDYTTSSSAKDALADKWRKWLGSPAVLHCTASGYPTYSTSAVGFGSFNLYSVHANMVITAQQFSEFSMHLTTAFRSLGALQPTIDDDVAEFAALLNTFARSQVGGVQGTKQVCTASGCPCVVGVVGEECNALPAPSSTAPAAVAAQSSTASAAPGGEASTAASTPDGSDDLDDTESEPASSGSNSGGDGGGGTTAREMSSTGGDRPCIRGVDCAASLSSMPSMMLSGALLIITAFRFGF